MYVLIGERTYIEPLRSNSRGLYVLSRPKPVIQDEAVALFTTRKKAEEYAESVTLVSPVWSLVDRRYEVTQRFFKKSVLDGFNSWRVQNHRKNDLPTNPHPLKRPRR